MRRPTSWPPAPPTRPVARRRRPPPPGCPDALPLLRSVGGAGAVLRWLGRQPRLVDRERGPALAALERQLSQQLDRSRIVVARPGHDDAVVDHPGDHLAAEVGADDGQRPVVVLADASGGDVGVLGRRPRRRSRWSAGPPAQRSRRTIRRGSVRPPSANYDNGRPSGQGGIGVGRARTAALCDLRPWPAASRDGLVPVLAAAATPRREPRSRLRSRAPSTCGTSWPAGEVPAGARAPVARG
jgi:hypothetical protein